MSCFIPPIESCYISFNFLFLFAVTLLYIYSGPFSTPVVGLWLTWFLLCSNSNRSLPQQNIVQHTWKWLLALDYVTNGPWTKHTAQIYLGPFSTAVVGLIVAHSERHVTWNSLVFFKYMIVFEVPLHLILWVYICQNTHDW